MNAVKGFLYNLIGSLLRLTLVLGITATVFVVVLGKPSTIESSLQANSAYSRYVPSLIAENKKLPQNADNPILKDPALTQILTDSFSSSDLKNKTEHFIDSIYNWLQGDTETLVFTIDFTANKRKFADSLANYAFVRFAALPICKQNPTEIDPLTAGCRPKNINLNESKQSYADQIFTSDAILKKTVFTQDDLPKNTAGQTIQQQFSYAPTVFLWLHRAPYIMAIAALFLILDMLLLSTRKRKAVKSLANIFMGSGISILVFPLLYDYIVPYFSKSLSFSFDKSGTQQIFNEITNEVSHLIDLYFIYIGLSFAVFGFLLWAAERLTRPHNKYHDVDKKAGVQISTKKIPPPNKTKLTTDTVPVQTSDGTRKKVKVSPKYRKLNKKEF